MKYIKLFESWAGDRDIATLRDVLNPDHYDEDFPERYSAAQEAALWTCERLGVGPGPEAAKLVSMGLMGLEDQLGTAGLDRVVEIYNELAVSTGEERRMQTLVNEFPALFRWSSGGFLARPAALKPEATEDFRDEIVASLHRDPASGVSMVWWSTDEYCAAYMLEGDLIDLDL